MPQALKPEPIAQPAPAKPMPQATIKLQVAPAPAAAVRKPIVSETASVSSDAASPKGPLKDTVTEAPASVVEAADHAENSASSDVPMPILIAAAALALVAFGIQLWTFLS
jgi:hypothetical protein